MSKILLVEDDMEISTMLKNFLTTEKFEVITAYDGKSALDRFFSDSFSLVLLDLMIPQISGIEVMEKIRENSTVPIIIISAKDTDSDKTLGLGLGADDYITKPFDIDEVIARIEANLRRNQLNVVDQSQKLVFKDIEFDKAAKQVYVDGQEITLTATEMKILELFLLQPQKVFSKANLFESIWNEEYTIDDNTLNVHISRLRHKLKKVNPNEEYIETLWGLGYRLAK